MKTKVTKMDYDMVKKIKPYLNKKPKRPSKILWNIIRLISNKDLKDTNFTYSSINMDKLKKNEPCIILMNHSSFIDLKMVAKIFKDRRFHVISTDDGFVGKEWLLYSLGCIPTKKFLTDIDLVKNMKYAVEKLHDSILMYPEASYTFDGTTTALPPHFSKFLKMFDVPVIMIKAKGAFLRDPLYNNLQIRKVDTEASVKYLFSKDDLKNLSLKEIQRIVEKEFEYNHFKDQEERNILINEPFRADFLNRIIYKCPICNKEGNMVGKGIHLTCNSCNTVFTLNENGKLDNTPISSIPTLYLKQRNDVIKEIIDGTYKIEFDCKILVLKDMKALYDIGSGHLIHTINGFHLESDDKKLIYNQSPTSSYSLYSDYYWYEIGDMICIGNNSERYYCFPTNVKDVVAKARIAQEEIYKYLKVNH